MGDTVIPNNRGILELNALPVAGGVVSLKGSCGFSFLHLPRLMASHIHSPKNVT
jgi:hypothetical protein